MKKTFYLTCHATSLETIDFAHIWYEKSRVLNEQGKREAAALARLYQRAGVEIIYTSPSIRAVETAEIIHQNTLIPYELDERFEGRNWGTELAGKPFMYAREWLQKLPKGNELTAIPKGGESLQQMQQRLLRAINQLANRSENNIAIITHSSTFRSLLPYFKNEPADLIKKQSYEGASVTVLDWKDGHFTIKLENSTDHLSGST